MTQKELRKRLVEANNGSVFITGTQLAKAMGYQDSHIVKRFTEGLDRIGNRYFIDDVAEALFDAMVNNG